MVDLLKLAECCVAKLDKRPVAWSFGHCLTVGVE
jgi:hypothetical protein